MKQAKRPKTPKIDVRSLPQTWVQPYPGGVATRRLKRLEIDDDLWERYAGVVGNSGRAADLREYIDWRVAHPDEPLPGMWRGPRRKERATPSTSDS